MDEFIKEYLSLLIVTPGYALFIWVIAGIIEDKQYEILPLAAFFFTLVTVLLVAAIYDIHCRSRARFGG